MTRLVKRAAIAVVVLVGLRVVSSFALDGLRSQRIAGNEASAIGSIRMVNSAQSVYASRCGGLYAPRLAALVAAALLSPDLGASDAPEKSGYRVTLTTTPGTPTPPPSPGASCDGGVTSFTVTAEPLAPGETGRRYFRSVDADDVVESTSASFTDAKRVR